MSDNKEDSKLLEIIKSLELLNSKVESLHEKVDKVQKDIEDADFSKKNTANTKSKLPRARLGTVVQRLVSSEKNQMNRDNDVQFSSIREVGETVFTQNLFRKASAMKNIERLGSVALSTTDRMSSAILSKNVQESLELHDEGFDFNQIIQNQASVGYKKSWIQFMLGLREIYVFSSLKSFCDFFFHK